VDWFARALKAKSKPLKWDYLDPACIDLDFKNVYAAVHKYTKSLVWRKLRFVAKSSNLELADLDGDVMTKVVQSYYALVPTKQPLAYIQNYLKRAAHNHVINIIKSETTHKRGRLVNVGLDKNNNRQFSLLTVSQNQASLKLDADGQPVVPDAEDESNSIATFEVRFSIDELLASIRVGSKKHRFLLIMLGTEDKEFSAWLKKYGHCSAHEDNCDVQDRTTVKEFNILLAKYLNVDVIRIENFLTKVRQQLAA
jgi:DNA-directed RNA polymerase specialized sigma24 family protein